MRAHEGFRRRSFIVVPMLVVVMMIVAQLPVHWSDLFHRIDWGSAPEWVGVVALIAIAVSCHRIARGLRPAADARRIESPHSRVN
jgi:hypothetical protein